MLVSVFAPICWTTALQTEETRNGFSFTRGQFRQESQLEFETGGFCECLSANPVQMQEVKKASGWRNTERSRCISVTYLLAHMCMETDGFSAFMFTEWFGALGSVWLCEQCNIHIYLQRTSRQRLSVNVLAH